jgi:prepilin-type N-terminal cleavage/methylation domain-containing protein
MPGATEVRVRLRRVLTRPTGDEGFGLIEVIVAMTILTLTFVAAGWLIVSSLSTSVLAKQNATAASLVQQVDALFQTNVPALTCANAATYVAAAGSGTAIRNGGVNLSNGAGLTATTFTVASTASASAGGLLPISISVTWKGASSGRPTTQTTTDQVQVQC